MVYLGTIIGPPLAQAALDKAAEVAVEYAYDKATSHLNKKYPDPAK